MQACTWLKTNYILIFWGIFYVSHYMSELNLKVKGLFGPKSKVSNYTFNNYF